MYTLSQVIIVIPLPALLFSLIILAFSFKIFLSFGQFLPTYCFLDLKLPEVIIKTQGYCYTHKLSSHKCENCFQQVVKLRAQNKNTDSRQYFTQTPFVVLVFK